MTEHPSRGTVYRLFRGRLSVDEREQLLRHLLSCPLCQGLSSSRVERQDPPVSATNGSYDQALERAFASALQADRGRREPVRRSTSRGSEATAALAVVDGLLEKSRACRYSEPRRMVELAELALAKVDEIEPGLAERGLLLDFKTRALAELANAYRIAGDLPLAAVTMRRAIRWLRRGTGDLRLRARVIDLLASLLSAQRRLDEAARLTRHLTHLYEQLGSSHLAARALISTGIILGSDARPDEGLRFVLAGLGRIDRALEPGLFESTLLTIINLMCDAGHFAPARRTLWRCRLADVLPKDKLSRLRLRWIEGKIYFGLDDGERAETALLAARRGFVRAEQAYMAAFVGLDLALLWVRQGEREKVLPLLSEMLATFRRLGIAREALTVLLVLRHALELPDESTERLCRCIALASTLLTQLERQSPGGRASEELLRRSEAF